MKSCTRCGKIHEDDVEICDECSFDFEENRRINKKLKTKDPIEIQVKSDIYDFPILSFIFGIVSVILPVFIFSIFAIKLSKKPTKDSLKPVANVGRILGYLGILLSCGVVIYLVFF